MLRSFVLENGQPLCAYLVSETDDYTLYSAPIIYFSPAAQEEYDSTAPPAEVYESADQTASFEPWLYNLRFSVETDDEGESTIHLLGLSALRQSEAGDRHSSRMILPEEGAIITPLSYTYIEGSRSAIQRHEEPYTVGQSMQIFLRPLPEGDYRMCFVLTDLYGESYFSEAVYYHVD